MTFKLRHLTLASLVLALLVSLPARGQTPRQDRARNDQAMGFKQNPRVVAAFDAVVARPARSVVRVRCDGKDVALGTIVAADGWILTKNSELTTGRLTVTLHDGRTFPARITGVEDHFDLAMLKIDAKNLAPIEWGKNASAKVGELLASPGVGPDPVAVGVLSVAARAVRARDLMIPPPPANAGFLGVALDEAEGGARVALVERNSAAAKAGLRVNDVVTLIADTSIIDSESVVNTIRHHKPGDEIPIKVLRDGKEIDLRATLGKRPPIDHAVARREFQNHLGSELSERRSGFPRILQHDMVLRPDDCGGPVVDLDGKALGINIARAGRVESYAIPAEAIQPLIDELKTGAPKPKPQLASAPKAPASTRPAPYPKTRVAGAPQVPSSSNNVNETTQPPPRPTPMPTPK
jgi:serine protease Do